MKFATDFYEGSLAYFVPEDTNYEGDVYYGKKVRLKNESIKDPAQLRELAGWLIKAAAHLEEYQNELKEIGLK